MKDFKSTVEIDLEIQLICSQCGNKLTEHWPEDKEENDPPDGKRYTFKILPCGKCLSEIQTEDCMECEGFRRRSDPYCRDCGRKLK